jgi:hypothetical protein
VNQATQLQRNHPPVSPPRRSACRLRPLPQREPAFFLSRHARYALRVLNRNYRNGTLRALSGVNCHSLDAISSVCRMVPFVVRRIEGVNTFGYPPRVGGVFLMIPKLKTRRGALNAAPGSFRA